MSNENQIYEILKSYVQSLGWIVLGGEPPGGTDHIPVIQLKNPHMTQKGIIGSKKIDLVFLKNNYFLLLELKEDYAFSDVEKLDEITSSNEWKQSFFRALREKSIHRKHGIALEPEDESKYCLIKALGFNKKDNLKLPDYVIFHINEKSVELEFGVKISDAIQRLFRTSKN